MCVNTAVYSKQPANYATRNGDNLYILLHNSRRPFSIFYSGQKESAIKPQPDYNRHLAATNYFFVTQ